MNIIKSVINFLFPDYCVACDSTLKWSEDRGICCNCRKKVVTLEKPLCRFCSKEIPGETSDLICSDCRGRKVYYDEVRSVFHYSDVIRDLIHSFKFNERRNIASELADFTIKKYSRYIEKTDFIIPVPLHNKREYERGYNQAYLYSRSITKRIKKKITNNIVKRIKNTHSQSQLDERDRIKNIRDAFKVTRKGLKFIKKNLDKCFLVIDDVFTTGSTINELCRILKNAGIKKILVLTAARG